MNWPWHRPQRAADTVLLFRFHDHFAVCENRLALLRALNPGCPIHGIYAGPPEHWPQARTLPFDALVRWREKIPLRRWRFGDLAVACWYRKIGRRMDFQRAIVLEWDLVLLAPVRALYGETTPGIAVADPRSLEQRRAEGWPWLVDPANAPEWEALQAWGRTEHQWNGQASFGFFPGVASSREFLEFHRRAAIGYRGNDELRFGFLAACGHFPVDTWPAHEDDLFNFERREVTPEALYTAAEQSRQWFHPVYQPLDNERVLRLIRPH